MQMKRRQGADPGAGAARSRVTLGDVSVWVQAGNTPAKVARLLASPRARHEKELESFEEDAQLLAWDEEKLERLEQLRQSVMQRREQQAWRATELEERSSSLDAEKLRLVFAYAQEVCVEESVDPKSLTRSELEMALESAVHEETLALRKHLLALLPPKPKLKAIPNRFRPIFSEKFGSNLKGQYHGFQHSVA